MPVPRQHKAALFVSSGREVGDGYIVITLDKEFIDLQVYSLKGELVS